MSHKLRSELTPHFNQPWMRSVSVTYDILEPFAFQKQQAKRHKLSLLFTSLTNFTSLDNNLLKVKKKCHHYITFYHDIAVYLQITFYHSSISSILSIFLHFIFTIINFHPLSSMSAHFIHFCPFHPFLSISIHRHPCLSISVHFIHFYPFSSTVIHLHQFHHFIYFHPPKNWKSQRTKKKHFHLKFTSEVLISPVEAKPVAHLYKLVPDNTVTLIIIITFGYISPTCESW